MSTLSQIFSQPSLESLRSFGNDISVRNRCRVVSQKSIGSSVSSSSTISIPEILESRESLMFMGFSETAAGRIFERWEYLRVEVDDSLNLFERVISEIESLVGDDIFGMGRSYRPAFVALGFTPIACDRLCHPEIEDWKDRFSACDIAKMAVESSWLFLLNCDSLVAPPATDPSDPVTQNPTGLSPISGPTIAHDPNFEAPPIRPPPRKSSKMDARGFYYQAGLFVPSSTTTVPTSLDGHKILYKGGIFGRLKDVFADDGTLTFERILIDPPGDFDRISRALYLTSQPELALLYCRLRANARGDERENGHVAVLTVAVPNEFFESIYDLFGDEWKKFFWLCRRSVEDRVLADTFGFLQEFSWLRGQVCTTGTPQINRLDSWASLRGHRLSSGAMSNQYMGRSSETRRLNEKCVGKVWLTACNLGN